MVEEPTNENKAWSNNLYLLYLRRVSLSRLFWTLLPQNSCLVMASARTLVVLDIVDERQCQFNIKPHLFQLNFRSPEVYLQRPPGQATGRGYQYTYVFPLSRAFICIARGGIQHSHFSVCSASDFHPYYQIICSRTRAILKRPVL